jgi:hypothetical protein
MLFFVSMDSLENVNNDFTVHIIFMQWIKKVRLGGICRMHDGKWNAHDTLGKKKRYHSRDQDIETG